MKSLTALVIPVAPCTVHVNPTALARRARAYSLDAPACGPESRDPRHMGHPFMGRRRGGLSALVRGG